MSLDIHNAFTPNGDSNNDVFFVKLENATSIELIIVNRWGNFMAKISDINDSDLNKFYSLTELKANDKVFLENFEIVRVDQVGYPDYLHYELMDSRAVFSWWNLELIRKSDQKKIKMPLMVSDDFNNKGKITAEVLYYSQKILESK